MAEPAYKPGYKTSEFWFTLVTFLCSGLFLGGIISNEDKESTISVLSHTIESIILVSGQTAIFWKYFKGRTEIKHRVIDIEQSKKDTPQPTPTKSTKKKTTPRKTTKKKTPTKTTKKKTPTKKTEVKPNDTTRKNTTRNTKDS